MIRWIARAALFRFLPRRLLPILTAFEVFLVVRALLGRKQPSSEPTEPQTSPDRPAREP
jgi:hypothetical protein